MAEVMFSTCLVDAEYDELGEVLTITFKDDGTVYTYDDVPSDVFNDLLNASSAGGYFNRNIRNNYSYTRQ